MSNPLAAFIPVLLGLGLAACSAAPIAPDQAGPLTVGNPTGVPDSIYCSPLDPAARGVGFAEVVGNDTADPAEILAIELEKPQNIKLNNTGAWKLDGLMEYIWSERTGAAEKKAGYVVGGNPDVRGKIVEPGEQFIVATMVEVIDSSKPAGAHQLLVRYKLKGKDYAELTNVTYELRPGGCN